MISQIIMIVQIAQIFVGARQFKLFLNCSRTCRLKKTLFIIHAKYMFVCLSTIGNISHIWLPIQIYSKTFLMPYFVILSPIFIACNYQYLDYQIAAIKLQGNFVTIRLLLDRSLMKKMFNEFQNFNRLVRSIGK